MSSGPQILASKKVSQLGQRSRLEFQDRWRKDSMASISENLGVIIDKTLNFMKQVDYIRQKTDRKMNLPKVLNSLSDVNASILKNIYTSTIQSTLEYGAVTFGMMVPSNIAMLQVSQNQGMRPILGVPRGASAKIMGHELQMLPVEHRARLSRAKLYRKIRGNTKHQLHATINMKWMDH